MTAKIIEFPTKPEKLKIEEQMTILQDSLAELYETLEKISSGHKELSSRCHDMEDTYQQLLQMYADEIGPENIGMKWLEYCTFVDFKLDPHTNKITLTFNPPTMEEPDESK